LKSDLEEQLDRAQSEAKAAVIRAKRIVSESRALLLNQKAAAAPDAPEEPVNAPPPIQSN